MKIQFDNFIRILRLFGTLAFCTVFMYWSTNAISKYIDRPISSTVSYQFGDDEHGNIDFPAITICLDTFKWVVWTKMLKNCSTNMIYTISDALKYCTNDNTQSQTTTTTMCDGLFGCIFNEEEDENYPFKKIEDFLNASKMFDITDILSGFYFGQTDLKDKIWITKDSSIQRMNTYINFSKNIGNQQYISNEVFATLSNQKNMLTFQYYTMRNCCPLI